MNDVQRVLNKNKISILEYKITPQYLSDILIIIDDEIITESIGKSLLDIIQKTGLSPKEIVEKYNLQINNDIENIENICKKIIIENPKEVNLYKIKPTLIGWFIGRIMRELPTANPKEVKIILEELLK
jgi:aspartyl-tRNA(Asn)/glutamyl-tRNA(Gln) amidotransferase subunit B